MTDDQLIDEVAAEMTSAPADAEFARRVSMRIAERAGTRTSWVRPWMLVPAAAAVLLMAVFVARDRKPGTDVRLKPDTIRPKPEATAAQKPRASLPPLAPIRFDRLDVQPLVELDAIHISPIAIDRIEIPEMP